MSGSGITFERYTLKYSCFDMVDPSIEFNSNCIEVTHSEQLEYTFTLNTTHLKTHCLFILAGLDSEMECHSRMSPYIYINNVLSLYADQGECLQLRCPIGHSRPTLFVSMKGSMFMPRTLLIRSLVSEAAKYGVNFNGTHLCLNDNSNTVIVPYCPYRSIASIPLLSNFSEQSDSNSIRVIIKKLSLDHQCSNDTTTQSTTTTQSATTTHSATRTNATRKSVSTNWLLTLLGLSIMHYRQLFS